MLAMQPEVQFQSYKKSSLQMMDTLENKASQLSVEFFIDSVKEGVWQGVCKLKVDGCDLAAVSVTENLSNITKDLLKKIAIQLPVRYKLNHFRPLIKPSFLYQ